MPSLIDAYNFDASIVEKPKKRKTFDEVIANIEPAISGAVKNIKDYQDRTARQKEMDEVIANGVKGYEWFNPEDPAHKAVIEEYVRTGNANGLAQQRSLWQNEQERIAEKARQMQAVKENESKLAAEKAAEEKRIQGEKDYANRWSKAKYGFDSRLNEIENSNDASLDKTKAVNEIIAELLNQGFAENDVYEFLNSRNQLKAVMGSETRKNTQPKPAKKPKSKWD